MTSRSDFAGGNQTYLRDVQYGDGAKLDVRTALHQRFSSAMVAFPDFAASLIDWTDDTRALDCGTGTGRFWDNRYVHKASSLTLTDLSPGMVQEAVSRARRNGFEHVTGRECDVQHLPYDDDSFDVVIANHMLYHVPDPDRAVVELARVLRPEGTLVAATNGYGHMGAMNDAIAEVFGSHAEALYEVFGIDTGEARLREQFTRVAWHAYDNDLFVSDPQAAVAYGLSFPPGETATDAQAVEFAAAIRSRFVDGQMRIRTRTGAFVCQAKRHP
ncbi:MAG: class I SAM-dependent methyltransferase [Actinobacteria bacterium]|nr:class I SAM-dependent methyltransferase [Actinomycetota bacterium]